MCFSRKTAFLGLGSNMGDRLRHLQNAVEALIRSGEKVACMSAVYETEPWGKKDQAAFLNQVIQVGTRRTPAGLLALCRSIENGMQRRRNVRWGPRTIDMDMLLYGDEIVNRKDLTVPHPRLHERRFMLVPLAEIAPDRRVPGLEKTVTELLNGCADTGAVRRYREASRTRRACP